MRHISAFLCRFDAAHPHWHYPGVTEPNNLKGLWWVPAAAAIMESMNLPQRLKRNARKGARVYLGQRAAAAIALAGALLWISSAPSAEALTRSPRAHAHTVAQAEQPAPSSSSHHGKSSAKKGNHAKAVSPHTGAAASGQARAHGSRSRRHQPEPEPVDDPIVMKRAAHGKGRLHETAAHDLASRATESRITAHGARTHETAAAYGRRLPMPDPDSAAPGRRRAEALPRPLPAEHAAPAADAPAHRTPAASPVYAEGVSHPDEMDEREPANIGEAQRPGQQARPLPVVKAAEPVTSPALATARVSGFGAEGVAPSHRTLARTMAWHRNTRVNVPQFSGAEQNAITDEAVKPMVIPAVYTRGGRLVMPAPLKGSHDVLVHQNLMADSEGLERIQDDGQLDAMLATRELTRLTENSSLHLNPQLPENRRYARPWTAKFAEDTAHAFSARFGTPLYVTSAVRTVNYQLRLMRTNGNAAAVDGDGASPHLTGQAIDIAKRGMSKAQLAWMRDYLLPLMQAGKVDVEEEFHQACFHVSVYRSYAPALPRHPKMEVAQIVREAPAESVPEPVAHDAVPQPEEITNP